MSSPSLTLQCRQCSGVFATPKVDPSNLVKCPHCATAAPLEEFEALQGSLRDEPLEGLSSAATAQLGEEISAPESGTPDRLEEGVFEVRGKWLRFDCPHCVRPMRLILEDAGGLVDCAHCGLELVAPDPKIGRGAHLSRASESRAGSISRYNPGELRGDQSGSPDLPDGEPELPGPFQLEADPGTGGGDDGSGSVGIDPHHSLARGAASGPGERKRAVKALGTEKLGRSFRRREVLAEQAYEASDTEWEPLSAQRRQFADSRQDRYGFWIALGAAAVVMAVIVAMVAREAGRSDEVFDQSQLEAIRASQLEQASRFQDSFAAAKTALASPTWEELLAHVRHPDRVEPLMRSYYSKTPYAPVQLSDFHAPVTVEIGRLNLHEMQVTEASGESRTLVIEDCVPRPKIDWELMVDLARQQWRDFLEVRPQSPQTIKVIAMRSSLLDRHFEDAGLDREGAIGIRLWQDGHDDCFAVVPKGDQIALDLIQLLEWDKGRKIVIRGSFAAATELDDRITIDGFVRTGWVTE